MAATLQAGLPHAPDEKQWGPGEPHGELRGCYGSYGWSAKRYESTCSQGYWTEHSERSVLPTRLSVLATPPTDRDILVRITSDDYENLDEREIAVASRTGWSRRTS